MSEQVTALSNDVSGTTVSTAPQSGPQIAGSTIPKSGLVYDYKVVESSGLKIVTIKTRNNEIRQITVREIGDGKLERGYYYAAGTATVFLTNEHLVGTLIPNLKYDVNSGIEYDSSYDPTKRSNCMRFWFDNQDFTLNVNV